jgi:hypothetical protein
VALEMNVALELAPVLVGVLYMWMDWIRTVACMVMRLAGGSHTWHWGTVTVFFRFCCGCLVFAIDFFLYGW